MKLIRSEFSPLEFTTDKKEFPTDSLRIEINDENVVLQITLSQPASGLINSIYKDIIKSKDLLAYSNTWDVVQYCYTLNYLNQVDCALTFLRLIHNHIPFCKEDLHAIARSLSISKEVVYAALPKLEPVLNQVEQESLQKRVDRLEDRVKMLEGLIKKQNEPAGPAVKDPSFFSSLATNSQ